MSFIGKLFRATAAATAIGVFALGATVTGLALAQDKVSMKGFGFGMNVEQSVKLEDIGLSLMPGAQPADKRDDNAVTMKMWGGDFSFQMAVGTYRSQASLDEVARYYQSELARYGAVEECAKRDAKASADKGSQGRLQAMGVKVDTSCDSKSVAKGGRSFRVGSKDHFRMVAIEPKGQSVEFVLMHLDIKE